jgi:hypothetical protein
MGCGLKLSTDKTPLTGTDKTSLTLRSGIGWRERAGG